jgi:hypothetical protein
MMNLRIKDLYSCAVAYAFDQRFIESPDGPRELQAVINEKFAELIIKECLFTGEQYADGLIDTNHYSFVNMKIKEHFGVE